jgi:hypothetical protein
MKRRMRSRRPALAQAATAAADAAAAATRSMGLVIDVHQIS